MATAAGSKLLGGGAWRGAGSWGARGKEQPVSMVRAGEPNVGSLSGQLEERVVSLAVGQGEDSGSEAVGPWSEGG